jgi:hypothetical protein
MAFNQQHEFRSGAPTGSETNLSSLERRRLTRPQITAPTELAAPTESKLANDLLIGANAIADELGLDPRQTYYWLSKGYLDADKVGDLWISTRTRLRRQFNGKREAS